IEKAKTARKRLLKLFAGDVVDEEEIRQELREWKDKEDKFTKQLAEITEQMNQVQEHATSQIILQEAVDYYLTKNQDNLTFEDKQDLIRMVIREVRSFEDRIELY